MPTYVVTDSRTGTTLRLTGDSPPTDQELEQLFSEHAMPVQHTTYDPTDGMSTGGKLLAGIGKGFHDLGMGAGQLVGLVDKKDVQDAQKLDAPLMNTGAGKVGDIVGKVAAFVPTAFIPGANTYTGASLIGAGAGLLNPVASGNVVAEKAKSAALGGALGAGSKAAADIAGAGYRLGKSVIEPFTNRGQQNIIARVLNRFANDPGRLHAVPPDYLPGYKPTLAEVTQDPGIAGLQRAAQNMDSSGIIASQDSANLQAVKNAIGAMGGDDAALTAARSARQATTSPLYAAADTAKAQADDALGAILQRPSMSKAWARASQLASESGASIEGADGAISGRTVQYLKMALDDMLDNPKMSGIGAHEQRALENTRSSLVNWAEKNIPALNLANAKYAELSAPINQMKVGNALYEKVAPALEDYATQPGARAASLANALRNSGRLVKNATGRDMSLDQVLSPDQMGTLQQSMEALARRAAAQSSGKAIGSNTAQNLAAQNMLRQTIGPLGLPQGFAEAKLWPTLLRPVEFAMKGQEPAIQDLLAQVMTDPQLARSIIAREATPEKVIPLVQALRQYGITPALLGANAAQQ